MMQKSITISLEKIFLVISPLLQPARVFVAQDQVEETKKILKDFDIHIFGVSMRNEDDE